MIRSASVLAGSLMVPLCCGCGDDSSTALPIEGSYTLTLHDADTNGGCDVDEGAQIRLDLRDHGGALRFALSSPYRYSGLGNVDTSDERLSLVADFFAGGARWDEVDLELDDDGLLKGTGEARGTASSGHGGTYISCSVSADVTLGADTLTPKVRFSVRDGEPSLPWRQVLVEASEPVDRERLAAGLTVVAEPGGTVEPAVAFFPEANESHSWLGANGAMVTPPWAELTDGPELTVTMAAGLTDPTGNVSVSASGSFALLALGDPQVDFSFDADIGGTVWGGATLESCDGESCLSFGSFEVVGQDAEYGVAQSDSIGIAGRLVTAGATSVVVTYRVMSPFGPDSSDDERALPIDMDVVTVGGTVTTTTLSVPNDAFIDGGDSDFSWVTDWRQHTVEIPAGDEHAFAIYVTDRTPCDGWCEDIFTFGFQMATIEAL